MLEEFLRRVATRLAPRSADTWTMMMKVGEEDPAAVPTMVAYEKRLTELKHEIDELRAQSHRTAELYDLVFERLQQLAPPAEPGAAAEADVDA